MNTPDKQEIKQKATRAQTYLDNNGYDAMIIGRQDNFAWFTDGGENRVVNLSESGAALLVITKEKTYLVAMVMDGRRIMEEELTGLDIEYVPVRWYEFGLDEKILEIVQCRRQTGLIRILLFVFGSYSKRRYFAFAGTNSSSISSAPQLGLSVFTVNQSTPTRRANRRSFGNSCSFCFITTVRILIRVVEPKRFFISTNFSKPAITLLRLPFFRYV